MANCSIRPLRGLIEQFAMYKNVNKILMNQCLIVLKIIVQAHVHIIQKTSIWAVNRIYLNNGYHYQNMVNIG